MLVKSSAGDNILLQTATPVGLLLCDFRTSLYWGPSPPRTTCPWVSQKHGCVEARLPCVTIVRHRYDSTGCSRITTAEYCTEVEYTI